MRIGYCRTSTQDQNLALQVDALNKVGCDRLFQDQMSGTRADRPGLKEALSHLREGDTLVIWKLDRLGRTVKGLIELVEELAKRKVHFLSITDQIDTSTPAGRFFFHIMASLSQMERETTLQRTHAGLQAARERGRIGGRRRQLTPSKMESAKQLLANGIPPKDVAKNLGVSVPTLYQAGGWPWTLRPGYRYRECQRQVQGLYVYTQPRPGGLGQRQGQSHHMNYE
jgi:DNA invertase Pin-like site-specific DNA recombinase